MPLVTPSPSPGANASNADATSGGCFAAGEGGGALLDDAARPRPGRPRSLESERAILEAALDLVLEVGYDRLSMDALAERAHASKATIYRHWSGKAEVVADAMRARVEAKAETVPDTGSLRSDLLVLLAHSCETLECEDGPLLAAVLWAMRSDPVLAELVRSRMVADKQAVFETLVARAIERGECDSAAAGSLAGEVIEAMILSRLVIAGQPLDEPWLVHLVDDVVLPLLGRPPVHG